MRAPVVIGWVLMGFRIDQSRADEMRQLLSVHVALMVKAPGGAMTLPVSTLPKDAQALLLASGGAAGELQTAEGTLLARSSPLDSVGGEVHSLLLRSVDEVVAPYRQLQVLLAIITVAGVLLFAVGTGLVAQRLATPLRSLLAATQRLSRGEYDYRWNTPTAPTRSATWRARSTTCAWTLVPSKPRSAAWPTGTA